MFLMMGGIGQPYGLFPKLTYGEVKKPVSLMRILDELSPLLFVSLINIVKERIRANTIEFGPIKRK